MTRAHSKQMLSDTIPPNAAVIIIAYTIDGALPISLHVSFYRNHLRKSHAVSGSPLSSKRLWSVDTLLTLSLTINETLKSVAFIEAHLNAGISLVV